MKFSLARRLWNASFQFFDLLAQEASRFLRVKEQAFAKYEIANEVLCCYLDECNLESWLIWRFRPFEFPATTQRSAGSLMIIDIISADHEIYSTDRNRMMDRNPLLENWRTKFALPPFESIKDQHFEAALESALHDYRYDVEAIASAPKEPDFENTILALERANQKLGRIASVFFNIEAADTNEVRQALKAQFSPRFAELRARTFTNPDLLRRVEAVRHQASNHDAEQIRVIDEYHADFIRAGASLSDEQRKRMQQISVRLAELMTEFEQNLLGDENAWKMPINERQLDELPEFLSAALRNQTEIQDCNVVLPLSQPLIAEFLTHSPDRTARKQAYAAWRDRGANGDVRDNHQLIIEILQLRHETALMLNFESYADFKLEREMAGSPGQVRSLLTRIWHAAKARADVESARLEILLHEDGNEGPLEPWDWRYYANKRRLARYGVDESEIKRYFSLTGMIDAAFGCARKLFNLEFEPVDLPLYHPDCRVWEVTRNGQHMALFIGDYFARSSKRSGAWCSGFRGQHKQDGNIRPIIINVCNFTKPADGCICQLSYEDSRILFHEFGHALHAILSNVTYDYLSCTSVAQDFVELPSQLFEHWLEVPQVLENFAVSADDGSPIPAPLIDKILKARTFDQAMAAVEYLASAFLDLSCHETAPPDSIEQLQTQLQESLEMPQAIGLRHRASHFAHIFATDSYASGYYSYMWSEVMDADAFEAFEEADGPFDKAVASQLESEILSIGGTVQPGEAYRRFRGRDPDPSALLRKRGFIPESDSMEN